jgi:hypothetical protein
MLEGKPRGQSALEDVRIDAPLSCRACGATLTFERFAIAPNGEHEHVCANPAGVMFVIRCFSHGESTLVVGEPTLAATWFPGYAWRIALCARCRTHVGWHFTGPSELYGFIKSALA